jgi:hypothetical protein
MKKRNKKILKIIKEIEAYDRNYYNGRLASFIIIILCLLIMFCFGLAFIVFS